MDKSFLLPTRTKRHTAHTSPNCAPLSEWVSVSLDSLTLEYIFIIIIFIIIIIIYLFFI